MDIIVVYKNIQYILRDKSDCRGEFELWVETLTRPQNGLLCYSSHIYPGSILNIRNYGTFAELDIYTFGVFCEDRRERPGHGGEWSSRPGVIHQYHPLRLIGVVIGSCQYFCTVESMKKLLAKILPGYSVIVDPNNDELSYTIVNSR